MGEAENAKAVYAALMKFGAPLEGLAFADFAELGPFSTWGTNLWPWILCQRFPESILMQRGSVELRMLLTRRPD